jgi:hypothetical protein
VTWRSKNSGGIIFRKAAFEEILIIFWKRVEEGCT